MEVGLRLQAELIDGRSRVAALRQVYRKTAQKFAHLKLTTPSYRSKSTKWVECLEPAGSTTRASDSGFPSAHDLPALGITYYDLERKLRVEEALWEALTKQYEAASVEEAKEIPTVQVLDPANVPGRKTKPVRRSIVQMGALISLCLGFVAVFLANLWEEMDPESEPKKMILDVAGATLDSGLWLWKIPGLRSLHRHFSGSSGNN